MAKDVEGKLEGSILVSVLEHRPRGAYGSEHAGDRHQDRHSDPR